MQLSEKPIMKCTGFLGNGANFNNFTLRSITPGTEARKTTLLTIQFERKYCAEKFVFAVFRTISILRNNIKIFFNNF